MVMGGLGLRFMVKNVSKIYGIKCIKYTKNGFDKTYAFRQKSTCEKIGYVVQ